MIKIKNNKKRLLIKLVVVLVFLGVYIFVPAVKQNVNQMIFYLSMVNLDAIKEYILSFGIWAPAISFLLMLLQSVAVPLLPFLITFANAELFGWVYGAILSWSSTMVGSTICFYISKFLGRDIVEKLANKYALKCVDNFFERYGKHTVLIARLLPFISFDLVSYAAGLTSMSFISFFIATGIVQLPATIIYSYVGGMFTGPAKVIMIGVMILFALSVLVFMIKKIYNEKNNKTINLK